MVGADNAAEVLLDVEHLSVWFPTPHGDVAAVRDVSFALRPGDALGLVGESGSGKTVTGLAIMGLLPPTARVEGRVLLHGRDLLKTSESDLRRLRGSVISMVFQEPMTALNPVFTVGDQLTAVIRSHRPMSRRAARRAAVELLAAVGIAAPEERFDQFPHQLSGGMRQRVMFAMALLCEPEVVIADEPTTAVDVTIQAQLLELLGELCIERRLALLLVSHDLGVIAEACHRVVVMYAGQVVEEASLEALLSMPSHPYSRGLLRAIPRQSADPEPVDDAVNAAAGPDELYCIPGRVPSPADVLPGCRFEPRCEFAELRCRVEPPLLARSPARGHVRCHRAAELGLAGAST